ncbi:hypothetical protein Tco_0866282, partial [Tanacetum coccineum]
MHNFLQLLHVSSKTIQLASDSSNSIRATTDPSCHF